MSSLSLSLSLKTSLSGISTSLSIKKMESSTTFKNPPRTSQKTLLLVLFLTLTSVVVATFFMESSFSSKRKELPTNSLTHTSNPIINTACTTTLYPSLCFTTLSSVTNTTFHGVLELSINETMKSVANARVHLMGFVRFQDLTSQEKGAMQDCLVMLDQTLYELGQGIDDLHSKSSSINGFHFLYDQLKTLLSAAMTNEDTCINGFLDLDEFHFGTDQKMRLKELVQDLLAPISRMISNCLSMITYMETLNDHPQKVVKNFNKFPSWMTRADRVLMEKRAKYLRPDIIVAIDGSGHYRTIGEAVRMAPNRSLTRFVIKIKAGVYNETVEIYREKINIMLIGEGMSRTIITGSRNLADGFSTINSATLTVAGDKLLARDLTVLNTAGPYKHQAVAARVTSNSAFYRCNFSSYQDTLFAHSFHQFYYQCTIKGTIDFIFGNAAAIFHNCLILVRKPIPGQRNMITAQGREDPNQNTGILLMNCTILAAPEFTVADRRRFATFLGRPWRNYSRTIVIKSYMGDLINSQGWCMWDQYSNLDTVEYVEYMNYGPGSDTRHRVNWRGYRKNCSEDTVKQFALGTLLHESQEWFGTTQFPLFSGS